MDYPVKTPRQLRPLLMGFRKAAGFTQAQVAARLGVTQQTYAQLEAKPESASLDRLFPILQMLKVGIVLTQAAPSALVKGRTPGRTRTIKVPVAAKKSAAKKRAISAPALPAAGAAGTDATPAPGRGQGSSKPAAGKPKAPTGAATRKREDW